MGSIDNINTPSRKKAMKAIKKAIEEMGLYQDVDDESIAQYVILVERNTELDAMLDLCSKQAGAFSGSLDEDNPINNYTLLLKQQKIIADRLAVFVNQLGLSPKARMALKTRKIVTDRQEKKNKYFT